jgi:hypothetical protein
MLKRLVLAIFAVFAVGGGLAQAAIRQPVAFNHKLHVEENGLDCVECHIYVKSQTFAGLPTVGKCMECHESALTSSPEEEKIRQAAADGKQLKWNRIYVVPNHVYYSHRRHVVAGHLECATCHGPIAQTTSPPPAPLNKITMNFCIECHQKNKVTNDCIACHK